MDTRLGRCWGSERGLVTGKHGAMTPGTSPPLSRPRPADAASCTAGAACRWYQGRAGLVGGLPHTVWSLEIWAPLGGPATCTPGGRKGWRTTGGGTECINQPTNQPLHSPSDAVRSRACSWAARLARQEASWQRSARSASVLGMRRSAARAAVRLRPPAMPRPRSSPPRPPARLRPGPRFPALPAQQPPAAAARSSSACSGWPCKERRCRSRRGSRRGASSGSKLQAGRAVGAGRGPAVSHAPTGGVTAALQRATGAACGTACARRECRGAACSGALWGARERPW